MNHYTGRNTGSRSSREICLPEDYALWCRIEDLSSLCGYDPVRQFGLLREIAETYPGRPGQDPEDYAGEHPMQALACMVRRYLAVHRGEPAERRTEKAA